MHVNQKPRRRHGEQFKAQVLAACAAPGASVSAVALSFGLNGNLVHQWRRGRGFKAARTVPLSRVSEPQPQFVALSLPAPPKSPSPAAAVGAPAEAIRVDAERRFRYELVPSAQRNEQPEPELPYHSLSGGFSAELVVDADGLVLSYPPYWRRVGWVA